MSRPICHRRLYDIRTPRQFPSTHPSTPKENIWPTLSCIETQLLEQSRHSLLSITSGTDFIVSMERSSPLAAMQPPSIAFGQWGCQTKLGHSISNHHRPYGASMSCVPDSFNFKDINMGGAPPTDYFNWKPIRGSSPTTSLAADLSQNFHIDQR